MNMKKSVSYLMKLLSLAIVLALISPVMIHAQTGKVNFAGTWTMNAEKSTLPQGGGGGRMGGDVTVAQEANLLTQTRTGQDGTARVTKYTLDGKESVNSMGGGESKSTAKWSADGKTLTIVTTFNFDGTDRTSSSVWSLVDAKTLSVVSTRQGQDGEVVTKLIYDKK
jgi:Tol biopolymer transport system component